MATEAQRLTEAHAKVVLEAQDLLSSIEQRGDGPTAEERAQVDAMFAEAADLREQRDSMKNLGELAKDGDKEAATLEQLVQGDPTANPDSKYRVEDSLHSLAKNVADGGPGGSLKANVGRAQNFKNLTRAGVTAQDIEEAQKRGMQLGVYGQEVRAYNVGTAASGGYLVPTLFERMLYDFLEYTAGVRMAGATVLNTGMGAEIEVPVLTDHFGVSTTNITAEAAAVGTTDDTFGEVRLGSYAFTASFEVTKELIQDNAINFDAYVGRSLSRTLMKKTEYAFTNGTGTSQPQGLFNDPPATRTVTTTGSNAIAYNDLLSMVFGLDAAYIDLTDTSCWTMGPATYEAILRILDSDGRPLFLPTFYTMEPDRILGRKIVYNPYCPAGVTTDNAIVATFGDHSDGYIIRDVGMVEVSVSPHVKFQNRQVVFLADMRCDGKRLHEQAIRWLKIKA